MDWYGIDIHMVYIHMEYQYHSNILIYTISAPASHQRAADGHPLLLAAREAAAAGAHLRCPGQPENGGETRETHGKTLGNP